MRGLFPDVGVQESAVNSLLCSAFKEKEKNKNACQTTMSKARFLSANFLTAQNVVSCDGGPGKGSHVWIRAGSMQHPAAKSSGGTNQVEGQWG